MGVKSQRVFRSLSDTHTHAHTHTHACRCTARRPAAGRHCWRTFVRRALQPLPHLPSSAERWCSVHPLVAAASVALTRTPITAPACLPAGAGGADRQHRHARRASARPTGRARQQRRVRGAGWRQRRRYYGWCGGGGGAGWRGAGTQPAGEGARRGRGAGGGRVPGRGPRQPWGWGWGACRRSAWDISFSAPFHLPLPRLDLPAMYAQQAWVAKATQQTRGGSSHHILY